jgi:transcriptional regulator with XRE-family HTH domain
MERPERHPQCGDQLRDLRERAGLTIADVALVIGLNHDWVSDLEWHDSELYSNVSLAAIQRLARLLRTTVEHLLMLEDLPRVGDPVRFGEIVSRLRGHLRQSGKSAASFGDEVGWDIEGVLRDDEERWNWSPDGLRDIATGVAADWIGALPAAGDIPPPLKGDA